MIRQTLTIAALAAVLATPAFAQTTKPMDNTDAQSSTNSMPNPTSNSIPSSTSNSMSNSSAMTTNATKPGSFVQQQQATEWRTSKLVGTDVYGTDNNKIGDISDVLIGSSGGVQAVVVGVGGFLGVGEKNVAIPFDALNISRKANSTSIDKITVTYSKDDLKNAPKFAWYQGNETTGSGTMNTTPGRKTDTMNSTTTPTNDTNTMKK